MRRNLLSRKLSPKVKQAIRRRWSEESDTIYSSSARSVAAKIAKQVKSKQLDQAVQAFIQCSKDEDVAFAGKVAQSLKKRLNGQYNQFFEKVAETASFKLVETLFEATKPTKKVRATLTRRKIASKRQSLKAQTLQSRNTSWKVPQKAIRSSLKALRVLSRKTSPVASTTTRKKSTRRRSPKRKLR